MKKFAKQGQEGDSETPCHEVLIQVPVHRIDGKWIKKRSIKCCTVLMINAYIGITVWDLVSLRTISAAFMKCSAKAKYCTFNYQGLFSDSIWNLALSLKQHQEERIKLNAVYLPFRSRPLICALCCKTIENEIDEKCWWRAWWIDDLLFGEMLLSNQHLQYCKFIKL